MQKFYMITYLVLLLLWVSAGAEPDFSQTKTVDSSQPADRQQQTEPDNDTTDNDTTDNDTTDNDTTDNDTTDNDTTDNDTTDNDTTDHDTTDHDHGSTEPHGTPITEGDSTQFSHLIRPLLATQKMQDQTYQAYFTSPDSIYPPGVWSGFHLYTADGAGLSDALRFHPRHISFPFSLSSSLNRSLPDGMIAPLHTSMGTRALYGHYAGRTTGMDILSTAEIQSIEWDASGQLHATLFPPALLKPQTLMFWETGVFDENILSVRFARPLSPRLYIGVFSTSRYFEHTLFDHQDGGIYSFYKGIYNSLRRDTNLVVNNGVNPLTDEHITTGRLRWESLSDWWLMGEYRYSDLKNDLAVDLPDTILPEEQSFFTKRSFYEHRTTFWANNLPAGAARLNATLRYRNFLERRDPRFDDTTSNRGTAQNGLLILSPYLRLFSIDTLTLNATVEGTSLERFNDQDYTYHSQTASLAYKHSIDHSRIEGEIYAEAGGATLFARDNLTVQPFWSARAHVDIGNHNFSLFGNRNIIEPTIPFDTISDGLLQTDLDSYIHAGAETTIGLGQMNLLGGYQYTNGIDPASLEQFWPNGVTPYIQPTSTFIAGVQTGRLHGLSMASTWYFADRRPYIKSHSVLSFQSRLQEKYQQFFVDMVIDHWSERDPILFAGNTDWNRMLLDISLKISVQVKTFRLFWKLDNILNRELAYVPGYRSPGLTFRWGFNWLLRGL